MAYQFVDRIKISSNRYELDDRKRWASMAELVANTTILMPNGFEIYVEDVGKKYRLKTENAADTSTYQWIEIKDGQDLTPATNDKLGGVIIKRNGGITVEENGTIYVDVISTEETTDEYGNIIKTEKIGDNTVIVTKVEPDGTTTITTTQGGNTSVVKKDSTGGLIFSKTGETVTGGTEVITETAEGTDEDGNSYTKEVVKEKTPDGEKKTTTVVTTDGNSGNTITEKEVVTSGGSTEKGYAPGSKETVVKDQDGNTVEEKTEPILDKDGKGDNLVTKPDIDDLMADIDDLW